MNKNEIKQIKRHNMNGNIDSQIDMPDLDWSALLLSASFT